MLIHLSDKEREMLVGEIQRFFYQEKGEEIGIIAAEIVLDFFLEKLAPHIYNKSLDEAKTWFLKKMEDIEIDYDILYNI